MSVAFSEPAELRDHYRAVRERLLKAVAKAPAAAPQVTILYHRPEPERIGTAVLYTTPIGPIHPDAETDLQRAHRLLAQISAAHGFTPNDVKSARREARLVRCRHEVIWRLKDETLWSLPQIGRFLGNRDHTSVLHGIRKHQALLDENAPLPSNTGPHMTAAEYLRLRSEKTAARRLQAMERGAQR